MALTHSTLIAGPSVLKIARQIDVFSSLQHLELDFGSQSMSKLMLAFWLWYSHVLQMNIYKYMYKMIDVNQQPQNNN